MTRDVLRPCCSLMVVRHDHNNQNQLIPEHQVFSFKPLETDAVYPRQWCVIFRGGGDRGSDGGTGPILSGMRSPCGTKQICVTGRWLLSASLGGVAHGCGPSDGEAKMEETLKHMALSTLGLPKSVLTQTILNSQGRDPTSTVKRVRKSEWVIESIEMSEALE